jgi:hypothetical protein
LALRQAALSNVSWRSLVRFVAFALVAFNVWQRMTGTPRGPMNTLFSFVALALILGTSRLASRSAQR